MGGAFKKKDNLSQKRGVPQRKLHTTGFGEASQPKRLALGAFLMGGKKDARGAVYLKRNPSVEITKTRAGRKRGGACQSTGKGKLTQWIPREYSENGDITAEMKGKSAKNLIFSTFPARKLANARRKT